MDRKACTILLSYLPSPNVKRSIVCFFIILKLVYLLATAFGIRCSGMFVLYIKMCVFECRSSKARIWLTACRNTGLALSVYNTRTFVNNCAAAIICSSLEMSILKSVLVASQAHIVSNPFLSR